ncbi:MAG: ribosome small subunit-dependent GTPase A [Tateyamaria sp.]|uniref:ribosome small subunit-dependent GTPase A n=1 Tax=Tateyamaria sp. TaxID=1929288 RepID=UPI0032861D25
MTAQSRSMLQTLGWQPFFADQVSPKTQQSTPPVRVMEVRRNALYLRGDGIDDTVPPRADVTVGDWLLLDRDTPAASAVLERKSLIKRRAPGHDRSVQLIAANIDTVFIVTSCNRDFNVARLERYIALAFDAGITPAILLTKSDLVTDAHTYVDAAQAISEQVSVIALNAKSEAPRAALAKWCGAGKTVAFLGSSGVGKSTLTNALAGNDSIETQAVRESDARGRHTTTGRQMHVMPDGCLVLDTPGVRELQLTDAAAGISDVFADLQELTTQCRFNDCKHTVEPGCAIQAALKAGDVDPARLARWRKLMEEEAFNSTSIAQRKTKDKTLGKTINQIQKQNRKRY